jgi:DNA-binding transcriptional LysR family regulator
MMDLNLLRVFDAVMTERHVGRAAVSIGRTQPAVSNALARLRAEFGDPLFVRSPTGVTPTARAEEIWRQVTPAIDIVRALGMRTHFVPSTTRETFRIACTDLESSLVLKPLVKALGETAPLANLAMYPGGHESSQMLLARNTVDVAIGHLPSTSSDIRSCHLFPDRLVVAMRNNHPLATKKLTMTRYASADHVLVSASGAQRGIVDDKLQQYGYSRRVVVTVNHFHAVPDLLIDSDLIATTSERMLINHPNYKNLHLVPPPVPLEDFSIQVYWHRRTATDPRHVWWRAFLLKTLTFQTQKH